MSTGLNSVDGNAPSEVRSLDDVPHTAQQAKRQEFLRTWYRAIALVPFAVVVFISLKFFPDSDSKLIVASALVSLIWAIGVAAYSFYLTFFGLKCPVCGWRFGVGDKCKHLRASEAPRGAHVWPERREVLKVDLFRNRPL